MTQTSDVTPQVPDPFRTLHVGSVPCAKGTVTALQLVLLLGGFRESCSHPFSPLLASLPVFPGGETNLMQAARNHATLSLLGKEVQAQDR